MANAMIKLLANARKAGVENYRSMSEDELRSAIKRAETGSTKGKSETVAKGKTSTNGRTPAKGKTTSPAKGKASSTKKTTSTTVPAKSTSRKTTPAKGKAAKGAQVKRPSTARGKVKTTSTKSKTVKRGKSVSVGTRAPLGKIDWNVESNVGQTGKRKDVLDALRKHDGDKAAAYNSLYRKATKFYPGRSVDEAERMLVWLIGRVAYDFAYKTGQHEPAERAAYGTSKRPADVKNRAARAAASKPRKGAKSRTAAKGKGKTAAKGKR